MAMTYIKTIRRTTVLLALAAVAAISAAQPGPQPRLRTAPLTAGMHVIQAELAQSPEQQMVGMMFRRDMGANDGMLFVNDEAGQRCFWMRNTLLPLSIAFIADDGECHQNCGALDRLDVSHAIQGS